MIFAPMWHCKRIGIHPFFGHNFGKFFPSRSVFASNDFNVAPQLGLGLFGRCQGNVRATQKTHFKCDIHRIFVEIFKTLNFIDYIIPCCRNVAEIVVDRHRKLHVPKSKGFKKLLPMDCVNHFLHMLTKTHGRKCAATVRRGETRDDRVVEQLKGFAASSDLYKLLKGQKRFLEHMFTHWLIGEIPQFEPTVTIVRKPKHLSGIV
mmetsp:Transcript_343/g.394  ORF Transcript_343/g.394 Transcript_343/m.394 type:complete len:205 (-) Transcript_343:1543-2157(-)